MHYNKINQRVTYEHHNNRFSGIEDHRTKGIRRFPRIFFRELQRKGYGRRRYSNRIQTGQSVIFKIWGHSRIAFPINIKI